MLKLVTMLFVIYTDPVGATVELPFISFKHHSECVEYIETHNIDPDRSVCREIHQ